MALYGLTFTWTLWHKALLKNQPSLWQLGFSQNLKLYTQAYIWKRLCSFLDQLHCMVNWLESLYNIFFQIGKGDYSTWKRSSVIWQKGESQTGGNKNTKHGKFSEKWTFFTTVSCYLRSEIRPFAILPTR